MKLFITIFLILSTATLTVLSLIQCGRIDLAREFHSQTAINNGERLFSSDIRTTSELHIAQDELPNHQFVYDPKTGLWNGVLPWQDRADGPKFIEPVIKFALNAEVVDSINPSPDLSLIHI